MEEYQQEASCAMLPPVIVLNNTHKHSKNYDWNILVLIIIRTYLTIEE